MNKEIQFGIDVGGTFTDVLVRDGLNGSILAAYKVPSTPQSPDDAILNGINKFYDGAETTQQTLPFSIFHATTVGTNTLIEKKGSKTALVTTKGFRDVLALRRQVRPKLYDLNPAISPPLIARQLCIEIDERIAFDGSVVRELVEIEIARVVRLLAENGVKSVAISLIHAYVNSSHENRIADEIRKQLTDIYVTTSADVCPEFREFERTSTVAVNAYIGPRVQAYMGSLQSKLKSRGSKSLSIVKSNGGLTSAANAGRYPVHLIESGPAAGIIAAAALAQTSGFKNLICFDMGGTTAKVGVVVEGQPRLTTEFYADRFVDGEDMGGYPIKSPVIDIIEIGAGGGSIASVALGGVIKVGPQSAGAVPGPACYSKGGTEPTVTDAHLIIGTLGENAYGAGSFRMNRKLAVDAMHRSVASKLGWTVERAAHGVVALATARMVEMVRVATLQRGFDPRDFVLLAYGGAGPLHASDIANEIGISRIVVPPYPGLFSAIGTLLGNVRHDFVKTILRDTFGVTPGLLVEGFSELTDKADRILEGEDNEKSGGSSHQLSLDMRYKGQLFEISVPLSSASMDSAEILDRRFRNKYRTLYGYELPDHATEIVNLRLTVTVCEQKSGFPSPLKEAMSVRQTREFIDSDGRTSKRPVVPRSAILPGEELSGPAIIEDIGATVAVRSNQRVKTTAFGGLLIESVTP